jgi:hypothetical protein
MPEPPKYPRYSTAIARWFRMHPKTVTGISAVAGATLGYYLGRHSLSSLAGCYVGVLGGNCLIPTAAQKIADARLERCRRYWHFNMGFWDWRDYKLQQCATSDTPACQHIRSLTHHSQMTPAEQLAAALTLQRYHPKYNPSLHNGHVLASYIQEMKKRVSKTESTRIEQQIEQEAATRKQAAREQAQKDTSNTWFGSVLDWICGK